MTTAMPVERNFPVLVRGAYRERMLEHYRYGLRRLINPDTGQIFSDTEIAIVSSDDSEAWIKADSLDAVLMLNQTRGLWLAGQYRPDRANSDSLKYIHGDLWNEKFLPASGGSGPIDAPSNALTTYFGSTTLGDPAAMRLTDPANKRYQVLFPVQSPADGTPARITIVGIDTGPATNLEPGVKLSWTNGPLGATGQPVVVTKFTGGIAAENDQQFASRLIRRIQHKPGAGNRAQIRGWAEQAANNAVESAFVYACALHAGTVLLAVTQKRGSVKGPTGRIASPGTLAAVTAYLAPPGSPVMPTPPRLVVVPCVGVPSSLVLSLSMPTGSSSGFEDFQPWPGTAGGTSATITAINVGSNPLAFRVNSLVPLPSGVTAPRIMVWDDALSRFEQLQVLSATLQSGTVYDVVLTGAPTKTLAVGDFVSPYSARAGLIDTSLEAYFDALGPGEVIDTSPTSSDSRRSRAFRFPKTNEEFPARAGTGVLSFLQDALGASLADSALQSITVSTPPLPSDPISGPRLVVAGKIGIYSL